MSEAVAIDKTADAPLLSLGKVERIFGGGRTLFGGRQPSVHAVQGISIDVKKGETLGIVGESGCGKSTLARMIAGLDAPSGGSITFEGEDLVAMAKSDHRAVARRIQYVFQDPLASLNPRKTIRTILEAPLIHLLKLDKAKRAERLEELMNAVNLAPEFLDRYPHEFSGGQAQRIGIARALAADPELIVLDEPVSARRHPNEEVAFWRNQGIHYFVPCVSEGRTIAVLALGAKTRGEPLSSEDVALLAAVAGQVATAIENGRLYTQLQVKASEVDRIRKFNENIIESLNDGLVVLDLEDEFYIELEHDEDCVAPGQQVQLTPVYDEETNPNAMKNMSTPYTAAGRLSSTEPSTVWAMTIASVALWMPISNDEAIAWRRPTRTSRGTR